MEETDKGIVFDIQSFSVHDGPGCRTTVFMSGCPLRCEWCANPESWTLKPHIMFSETSCKYQKGCSICKDACPHGGLTFDDMPKLNWDICKNCDTFECSSKCYYDGFKVCGKEYSVDEIMKVLTRDSNSWSIEGGVTFSGGEPLLQSEFLIKVLKECKKNYFHTAIETTAYKDNENFLKVMEYIDFAFIDVKHINRDIHRQKTGVYNDIILNNIRYLKQSGWKGRLILRMPVIRDFNDTYQNITDTIQFMKENDLFEINILPFHRLGESKWRQLGKEYKYKDEEGTDPKKLEEIQDLFLENEIACYIGYDTAF
ncbi:4-hydroxyphenylacetate decarboxylase activase [Tepidibacter aestuarii]|uniref:4-hydroxyphenylacetate decarboxylase activase n=1 Tax=Tepidibacter aestuarii TaxID=2925782 RepID=UPI0020BEA1C6|nr:4-hydroxyphenylacetate decarboxylase activase [Tepidibacter aestuarii]CAH2214870.1 4-hydroxyphenylacetate decarboxylase activating enzyme [Tepidibacter aestuarii]